MGTYPQVDVDAVRPLAADSGPLHSVHVALANGAHVEVVVVLVVEGGHLLEVLFQQVLVAFVLVALVLLGRLNQHFGQVLVHLIHDLLILVVPLVYRQLRPLRDFFFQQTLHHLLMKYVVVDFLLDKARLFL